MKLLKLISFLTISAFFTSCQSPAPVYVPVYIPVKEAKKPAPRRVVVRETVRESKPTKSVESAENFRAVEKPTSYSRY
jgi:hypothetical protein